MKLIIDISQNDYEEIKEYGINTFPSVARAIQNGTPLPQGHGRLIDADAYREKMYKSKEFNFFTTLDMQPTIIEADIRPKEGGGEK